MNKNKTISSNGIGNQILEVMLDQGIKPTQLADMICTSRSNVYNITNRNSMDCDLLYRISIALKKNFFADLSADVENSINTVQTSDKK